jgi:hypothetical protein
MLVYSRAQHQVSIYLDGNYTDELKFVEVHKIGTTAFFTTTASTQFQYKGYGMYNQIYATNAVVKDE